MFRKILATSIVAASMLLAVPAAQANTETEYREATVGVRGMTYDRVWGTCSFTRQNHGVRVDCDRDEQIAFRYHVGRPVLGEGEYISEQWVGANIERLGGSGEANVTRNGGKVRVYVEGTFNGVIHRVWRSFLIGNDSEVSEPSEAPVV